MNAPTLFVPATQTETPAATRIACNCLVGPRGHERPHTTCPACHGTGYRLPEGAAEPAPVPRKTRTPYRANARAALEAWLKQRSIPYVVVDEARKAIFAGNNLKSFDFLVYSSAGPNLLALVFDPAGALPCPVELAGLVEWEKVFGGDFVGALVFLADGDWRVVRLSEWHGRASLATARPLEDVV